MYFEISSHLRNHVVACTVGRVLEALRHEECGDVDQSDDPSLQSLRGTCLLVQTFEGSTTSHATEAMHDNDDIVVLNKLRDGLANFLDVLGPVRRRWCRT